MRRATLVAAAFSVVAAGCSGSSPAAPTPPPQSQTNRMPVITSASVSPSFGIAEGVTTFTFTAEASDPDGDPLIFTWNLGPGNPVKTGPTVTTTYTGPGQAWATVTVTDGRDGRAERQTNTSVISSLDGLWQTTQTPIAGWIVLVRMDQRSEQVFANWTDNAGNSGTNDPGEIGRIDASGAFVLRLKVTGSSGTGQHPDFYIRGRLEAPGTRISGTLDGSGFTGEAIAFERQP